MRQETQGQQARSGEERDSLEKRVMKFKKMFVETLDEQSKPGL